MVSLGFTGTEVQRCSHTQNINIYIRGSKGIIIIIMSKIELFLISEKRISNLSFRPFNFILLSFCFQSFLRRICYSTCRLALLQISSLFQQGILKEKNITFKPGSVPCFSVRIVFTSLVFKFKLFDWSIMCNSRACMGLLLLYKLKSFLFFCQTGRRF